MIKHFLYIPYSALNWWNKILLITNFIIIFFTLLSYLAPYINPNATLIFAFLGLLYPLFLGLNLAFILYWIFKYKKLTVFSIGIIFIGFFPLTNFFQITFFQNSLNEANKIKIMTFNVRVFDLYNWQNNSATKDNIVSFIENVNPDVICFQEYYKGENIHFSVNNDLKEKVNLTYFFEHFTGNTVPLNKAGKNNFGTAIFSKLPIIKTGVIDFYDEKSNNCIYADIVKNKDTIRVFNAHIGSIRLQKEDYLFLGGDESKQTPTKHTSEQDILRRMAHAYRKRSDQSILVMHEIKDSPHPSILCIDMNDVPLSFAYKQISSVMNDAFVKSGNGIDGTYIGDNFFNRIFPVYRIDYIFAHHRFKIANFQTHTEDLSDHRAVSVELELSK